MLRFLDRFSLEARILLALGLPLVAIVWMTVAGAFAHYREVSNLQEVGKLSQLTIQVGSLVHYLQVERGASHGYLGSEGRLFSDTLSEARATTDHQLDQLRQYHEEFAALSSFRPGLTGIVRELSSLSNVRQRVDSVTISGQQALDYYTRVNLQLNDLIAGLAHHSRQPTINRQLAAYYTLAMYKELVGQERALTTLGLSSGIFRADQQRDLLQLWGEQHAFYNIFLRLADSPHDTQLQAALHRYAHPERTRLRQTLRANAAGFDSPLPTDALPTAAEWFGWQTDYINQLKAVEDSLAAAIMSLATAKRQTASFALWRYLVISPLSVLTALLLLYLIIRSTHLRLKLADTIFNHTDDGITVTDHDANIIDTNRAFARITGYAREQVTGKNPRILQSGRHGPDFYTKMWQQLTVNGTWQGEIWNRRKSGELYAELLTISAVRNKSGKAVNYVAIFSDITERANSHQQQLERIAHYDPLTGLPNRTLLVDRLDHALSSARREQHSVAIAVINLDDFKAINERQGYSVGDRVLEIMAERFQTLLRDSDTLARLGGNEFAVILEGISSPHDASAILKRFHRKAAAPITIHDTTLTCSASIGTTYFPLDDGEAETLLRHAQQALLQAKLNGRNRIHLFDLRDAEQQSSLSRLIQRLERALVDEELVLHYQPKVDMVSGELLGVEALLRWEDPEHGMVPPGAFLPCLEQHPIAITIGHWVIKTALAQLAEWQRQGHSTQVSINLSAQELLHPRFVPNLRARLADYPELPDHSLELEILESAAIGDIKRANQVLNECRSLGVSIALDDFGTGYASLDYLKHMPADTLKIDQTFIRDMLTDSGDRMIVTAIISLADAFNFDVIAEGVEHEAQGLALIEMGCRRGQGFGIGRPMPAEALFTWYQGWRTFPNGAEGDSKDTRKDTDNI